MFPLNRTLPAVSKVPTCFHWTEPYQHYQRYQHVSTEQNLTSSISSIKGTNLFPEPTNMFPLNRTLPALSKVPTCFHWTEASQPSGTTWRDQIRLWSLVLAGSCRTGQTILWATLQRTLLSTSPTSVSAAPYPWPASSAIFSMWQCTGSKASRTRLRYRFLPSPSAIS